MDLRVLHHRVESRPGWPPVPFPASWLSGRLFPACNGLTGDQPATDRKNARRRLRHTARNAPNPERANSAVVGSGVRKTRTSPPGSRFVIGTGSGALPVMKDVKREAERRKIRSNNATGQPRPGGFVDQYGFELDGPAYIPKVYKGKERPSSCSPWRSTALFSRSRPSAQSPQRTNAEGLFRFPELVR